MRQLVWCRHRIDARSVVYNKGGKQQTSRGFDDPKQTYHDDPHNFSNQVFLDLMPGFVADPANAKYLLDDHYTELGGKKTLVKITNVLQAKQLYQRLKLAGRDAFDKAAGINHFANPNVGESYTMATEANMPGFKKAGDMTWNFHWAGVVLKDEADNVTLENFAVTAETAKDAGTTPGKYIDRDWNFDRSTRRAKSTRIRRSTRSTSIPERTALAPRR